MDNFDSTAALVDATLGLFDLSADSFPFDDTRCKKIEQRRKQLDGQLFVDYMLSQAAIVEPTKKFPPRTVEAFKILVTEIVCSDWGFGRTEANEWSQETAGTKPVTRNLHAGLKRSCLIYYLLAWWNTNAHGEYSVEQRLPNHYIELTHAFFFLDTGKSTLATSLLSTPLIEQDVAPKVFQALSIATDADPNVLILRYARMAKPIMNTPKSLEIYLSALSQVNFMDAWNYQRGDEGPLRFNSLHIIFKAILIPRPSRAAIHLLSAIPLQPFEQDFLYRYVTEPPMEVPEQSLATLQSLVILRLTQEGDYTTAVRLNREFSQMAEKLLTSTDVAAFGEADGQRPGMILAQKNEEWREMLRESVALLPIEHRRVLESQINEGAIKPPTSFANPHLRAIAPHAHDRRDEDEERVRAIAGPSMEMSWESIEPIVPDSQSTPPPPGKDAANTTAGTLHTDGGVPVTPLSSPQKRSRVARSSAVFSPIETQTLGRVAKAPTPKRPGGLMSYMTPLRTPMLGATTRTPGETPSSLGLEDRSGAPPPSTGRVANKNAFFDPNVRAVKGLILSSETPVSKGPGAHIRRASGDVEMRDADDGDTDIVDEQEQEASRVQEEQERVESTGEDESYVIAPPPPLRSRPLVGRPDFAAKVAQIKKAVDREQERRQQEEEASARQQERLAQREREAMARRAKLEQHRQSLGHDSSFGSASGGTTGKRKRDEDDTMTREDAEKMDEDDSVGKGKRKTEAGPTPVVRKPGVGPRISNEASIGRINVPEPPSSTSSRTTRSAVGAHGSSTTAIPSSDGDGGQAHSQPLGVRRSARTLQPNLSPIAPGSATGGSQGSRGGSLRGPSPSTGPSETGDTEEAGSPRMPGAFFPDEEEDGETKSPRKSTRRSKATAGKATPVKPSTRTKPDSKTKTETKAKRGSVEKPPSTGSQTSQAAPTQRGRGKRGVNVISVPQPIEEDKALETAEEESDAGRRGKRGAAGVAIPPAVTRRSLRATASMSAAETTEAETDELDGESEAVRRSSRRLATGKKA